MESLSRTFEPQPPMGSDDLEVFTLQMVRTDPFVTISEIRRSFSRQPLGEHVGWWRVFKILRRHHLLRRRSRFLYAWGRN